MLLLGCHGDGCYGVQVDWERTDTYLVTAHTPDCIVRVWQSSTGHLVTILKVATPPPPPLLPSLPTPPLNLLLSTWYSFLFIAFILLLLFLQEHTGEVFVLECHPHDSTILLSAGACVCVCVYLCVYMYFNLFIHFPPGHDGLIIIWDMLAGVQLKKFKIEVHTCKCMYVHVCMYVESCFPHVQCRISYLTCSFLFLLLSA